MTKYIGRAEYLQSIGINIPEYREPAMTDHIEPALSAGQWAAFPMNQRVTLGDPADRKAIRVVADDGGVGVIDGWGESSSAPPAVVIAVANHIFPDSDPRKITREMVGGLRSRAEEYRGLERIQQPGDWAGDALFLDAVADALESYLPPP
jgi:hypothetical protein